MSAQVSGSAEIPAVFHDLLSSKAVAMVGTIGRSGEPQVPQFLAPVDEADADPRISLVVVDPARPTYYVELRGRIDDLVPDPELALEQAVARKYTGGWSDVEPPGTTRYTTSVIVDRITSQLGH